MNTLRTWLANVLTDLAAAIRPAPTMGPVVQAGPPPTKPR